jgi:hypothetical protein
MTKTVTCKGLPSKLGCLRAKIEVPVRVRRRITAVCIMLDSAREKKDITRVNLT